MRKINLLFLLAAASLSSFAQYNGINEKEANLECAKSQGTAPSQDIRVATNRAAMDTINNYYFDFSDLDGDGNHTLPSGWTSVDKTSNGFEFVVTDTTYTGAYTNGSDGSNTYSSIESATAANGFLHLPSDYYNCVPGVWPREMVDSPVDMDAYVETDWMDFSSSANGVIMRFSEWFRFCCSSANTKWEVSVTVNGSDWTTMDAMDATAINDYPTTVNGDQIHIMEYNITEAISADPTHVKIRFSMYGGSHYFVSLDDLVFVEPYPNDISILHAYSGMEGIYTLSAKYSDGSDLPYNDYNTRLAAVPYNIANRLQLGAELHQNGKEGQNVGVAFSITDDADASEFWSGNTTTKISSFEPATGDSVLYTDTTNNFANAPIFYAPTLQKADFPKNYTFSYSVTSDNTNANTTKNTASFAYTQTYGYYAYHHDNTAEDEVSMSQYVGSDGATLGAVGDRYAVNYDFLQEDGDPAFKIWGMRFYVGKSTNLNADEIGVVVQPKLFYYDGAAGEYVEVEDVTTNSITIEQSMIDTFVYAAFNYDEVRDYDFPQGTYLAVVEVMKTNGCKFYIGTDKSYFQGKSHFKIYTVANDTWYYGYVGSASGMIDLYTQDDALSDIDPNIRNGQKELQKSNTEIYPNPTQGVLYIKNAKESVISVYSLTGVLVKTVKNNDLNTQINLSNLAKGTYLVRVVNNDGVTTRKINLTK